MAHATPGGVRTRTFTGKIVAGALCLTTWVVAGCGSSNGGRGGGPDEPLDPGSSVDVQESASTAAAVASLRPALDAAKDLSTADFLAKHQPAWASLDYDPGAAAGLAKIQASRIPLGEAQLALLKKNGFVIDGQRAFPTFAYGYETLYAEHLPLFVSADSILDAVHRSYDNILQQLEEAALSSDLATLLSGMRQKLSGQSGEAARDADFFLAVALSLLNEGAPAAPVAGADAREIAAFVDGAQKAAGAGNTKIFGVARDIDFSQFEPRGHYRDTEALKRYFRAMMWLGRIEFRLIEAQPDHSMVFRRRQFDAMLALWDLMDEANRKKHEDIDSVIAAFVGKSDNLVVADVGKLLADLGVSTSEETRALSDAKIAQAIVDGGYGTQLIASQLMYNDSSKPGPLPLSRSFLLFGQRYVIDSHVFSNVTYSRTAELRMLPDPLDVAFAVQRNDGAARLLEPGLTTYSYAPNLESMRILVDAHEDAFWSQSLYNVWLASLRTLSPGGEAKDPRSVGLPLVTGTEAWNRRVLNTQLASWAQLRHDTILYAKQSYTDGSACEFPDAYVEPYPEFFATIAAFARRGREAVGVAGSRIGRAALSGMDDYFTFLGQVATQLQGMAQNQRDGTPFTAAQMAFINEAVTVQMICGSAIAEGWYPRLVYGNSLEFDPTIADVHTQFTDEGGNPVGRVLHVGTGNVRLMVMTADTCQGPRAYAGLVSTYYERVTEGFKRMTDQEWKPEVEGTPKTVGWMAPVVVE